MAATRGSNVIARHRAQLAALYAAKPQARLMTYRRAGGAVLVLLALPDGSLKHLRMTSADGAELDALPENERSRIRSAFLANAAREAPNAT